MGWAAVLVWLAACGNPEVDAYHRFVDARNQIYCQAVIQCCTPAEIWNNHYPHFTDVPSCIQAQREQATSAAQPTPTGALTTEGDLSEGIVHFDPAAAEQCLDELRSAGSSCDHPADLAALLALLCRGALVGTRPAGATCANNEECASDGVCDQQKHVCQAFAEAGEACGPNTNCDFYAGLICLSSGTCGPASANGQACTANGADFDCQSLMCESGACAAAETVHDYVCSGLTFSL
jgi:hypothetical protein